MKEKQNIHDNTPIRSEKVAKLLGEIPRSLMRWGAVILALLFSALVAAIMLLPYPYSNGETIFQHIFCNMVSQK